MGVHRLGEDGGGEGSRVRVGGRPRVASEPSPATAQATLAGPTSAPVMRALFGAAGDSLAVRDLRRRFWHVRSALVPWSNAPLIAASSHPAPMPKTSSSTSAHR